MVKQESDKLSSAFEALAIIPFFWFNNFEVVRKGKTKTAE